VNIVRSPAELRVEPRAAAIGTFDGVHLGLQESGSAIVPGTNKPLQFGGRGTFNERNNGDRYFNPNNLMGR